MEQHCVPCVPGADAGIRRTVPRRRRPNLPRNDPVAVPNPLLRQYRREPLSGIPCSAHKKLAPNPRAAPTTSSVHPAFGNSSGGTAVSPNGHSRAGNAQANPGSPTDPTTSARPPTTRPGPTICAAGMLRAALRRPPGKEHFLGHPVMDRGARHLEPGRSLRNADSVVAPVSAHDERARLLRHASGATGLPSRTARLPFPARQHLRGALRAAAQQRIPPHSATRPGFLPPGTPQRHLPLRSTLA